MRKKGRQISKTTLIHKPKVTPLVGSKATKVKPLAPLRKITATKSWVKEQILIALERPFIIFVFAVALNFDVEVAEWRNVP